MPSCLLKMRDTAIIASETVEPNAICELNSYLSIAVYSFHHQMHSRQNTRANYY